jgi:hypothetical protein|tara:strand:- start:15 stop:335 length:321 start_codon:yes stop_codon:yes gene_type:complete
MATITEVAEKFDITPEQVGTLREAMSRTWSQVCYDYFDCFEGGEREAYSAFDNDEAALITEATLDADRVTTFCPDEDLKWVYQLEDGTWRKDVIALGKATWNAQRV